MQTIPCIGADGPRGLHDQLAGTDGPEVAVEGRGLATDIAPGQTSVVG